MTSTPAIPDPDAFGLVSFADVLPDREPIVGEDPGSFDSFYRALMTTLAPATPYECVIAENLIAIEWELLQHRRMRDACIRKQMRDEIRTAVVKKMKADHEARLDDAWNRHEEAGGTQADWKEPFRFDRAGADEAGEDLADRATSRDSTVQAAAYEKITALGLKPVELMSEAYASRNRNLISHEERLQELERRRREVKRDFDVLQKTRPVEAVVIDA